LEVVEDGIGEGIENLIIELQSMPISYDENIRKTMDSLIKSLGKCKGIVIISNGLEGSMS